MPFGEKKPREEYLGLAYEKLHSNLINYKPNPPRKYLSYPKSRYVIRMIPTFEMADYCIYYYCIKVLESYIAKNRIPGTFGGFRMGGKIRKKESLEFEPGFENSINENSFNAFAWKKEYGEYQSKLYKTAREMGNKFSFAVSFDIANFYDCIDLAKLRNKIEKRLGSNTQHKDEVYLLFRFLRYWNEKFDSNKNVGIPQDEVAECSRILANFFLQDYDKLIHTECLNRDSYYLRYTDDQIIFTKSKQAAKEIMYIASQKLFEEGLNINNGKILEFNNFQEFDDCYGFSVFENLQFDHQDINQAFEQFVMKKQSSRRFRESSILRRILHKKIDLSRLHNQKRLKLLSYLWDENFLLFATDHTWDKSIIC